MAGGNEKPVIIRRKKVVGGDGHHGGAWKVAYADFVTAMMAFFMLMWLLNATTEKQRKGLADYFSPSIPVTRVSGGGSGSFGGDSIFSEDVNAQSGTGGSLARPSVEHQSLGMQAGDANGLGALEAAEAELLGMGGESMIIENAMRHVMTRVTDEGLIIELFDLEGEPLFAPETGTPTEVTEVLAGILAGVFGIVTNEVAVKGYVAARPLVLADNPVWDLSARRADAFRALLEGEGLAPQRMDRISGHADRSPAVDDPMAARNNRLEVVLLRSDI